MANHLVIRLNINGYGLVRHAAEVACGVEEDDEFSRTGPRVTVGNKYNATIHASDDRRRVLQDHK